MIFKKIPKVSLVYFWGIFRGGNDRWFSKKSKEFPSVYFRGYFSRRKCQNALFVKISPESVGTCFPEFSDSDTFFRSTIITADTVNTVRTFSRLHLLIAFSSCIMKTNRCKKFIWNCTQLEPEKKQKLVLKWTLVLASRTNSRRGGISFDDLFQRES